jgi:protein PhnA
LRNIAQCLASCLRVTVFIALGGAFASFARQGYIPTSASGPAARHPESGASMSSLPKCPKCSSEYTYEDGDNYVCPECAHEWPKVAAAEEARVVRDSNGNVLQDGDTVTVIKDLKVKGASSVLKVGTKVKNIRIVEGDHDIDCKIDGFGAMQLKSEFVKKV